MKLPIFSIYYLLLRTMSANFLKILFSILIAISECYGINKVAFRDSLYKPILITSDFSHKLVGQEDSIYIILDTLQEINQFDILNFDPCIFKMVKKATFREFIFDASDRNIWMLFGLKNETKSKNKILFEFIDPYIEVLEVYAKSQKSRSYTDIEQLAYYSFDKFTDLKRNNRYNFPAEITLKPKESQWIAVKIRSSRHNLNFSAFIWNQDVRTSQQFFEDILLGTFFGIELIFLIILILLVLSTFDKLQAYFLLFFVLGIIFVLVDIGFEMWLWSSLSINKPLILLTVVTFYLIAGILFVQTYFGIHVKIWKSLTFFHFIAIIGATLCCIMWICEIFDSSLIRSVVQYLLIFFLAVNIFILLMVAKAMISHWKLDHILFILGFLIHGISIFIINLQMLGILPHGLLNFYVMKYLGFYPFTFYTNILFLLGVIVELMAVFYLLVKNFIGNIELNTKLAEQLAREKELNLNSLILGIETERKRIGQELHDGLGVLISSIKMKTQKVIESTDDKHQKDKLQNITADLDLAYTDVRHISHNLMPKSLERQGLKAAIEDLLHRVKNISPDIDIHLLFNIDLNEINDTAKIHIYRILQELCNNIVKHAKAKEIIVQFFSNLDGIIITIEDDGIGFDLNQPNKGIGLQNLKIRAKALSAKINLESRVNHGTFVSIEIPHSELTKK